MRTLQDPVSPQFARDATHPDSELVKRRARIWLAAALGLFLLLAFGYAVTKKPWLDEGLQASAAYNLVTRGTFGLPQLEESGMTIAKRIPEIQRHCFIFLPNYLFAAAAWMKLFGYGLVQIRTFSIVWGVLALFAWHAIIKRLTGNIRVAGLGALLLGTNYVFIVSGANGRFDMMTTSFGAIALALFLALREKRFEGAVFAGSFAAAAAFFTHPMGVLYAAVLIWTILALDRGRIRFRHVVLFALPFALFAAAMLVYVWPYRDVARAQFAAHTENRWQALHSPLTAVITDAVQRYLYFFFNPLMTGAARLKGIVLFIQAGGLLAALLIASVRRSIAFRVLGPGFAIVYIGISLLDSLKYPYYMIHAFCFASAIVSLVLYQLWKQHWRAVALLAGGTLILLHIGGMVTKIQENSLAREYHPAIAYIRSRSMPADYVEGEISLNFGLGYFDPRLHMDNRMGYYTGKRPRLIIVGEFSDIDYFRITEPDLYRFIRHRLDHDYWLRATFGTYRIYEPR